MAARFACLTLLGAFLFVQQEAKAQIDARMFRYPDVSETSIAFVYAGDIWVADKAGGTARRLSSPPGEELFPRFSPDGSRIAFSGNYDGNTDVYSVPAAGGEPARVTHHPGSDRLIDWTHDGRLLFASSRASGVARISQLYLASPKGGLPEKLPVAYGEFGSLSPDGGRLAFTLKSRGFRTWKRYRGGLAPDVWLLDLDSLEARNLTRSDANDAQPMWHGDTIYFLSDRGPRQRSNIWAYDLKKDRLRQVTRFDEFDITFPALGPSEIVFQAGGRLYLLDLDSEKQREVKIDVVTDLATLRPRTVNVSRLIQNGGISPTGKRAVFEARGEIFTVPAEHGVVRRLSNDPGSAERFPAWSPDGKQIACWSDRGGEYQLTVQPSNGGPAHTLTNLGPGYRYRIHWSPDSKKLAFIDHAQKIRLYDLESEMLSEIDQGLWMLHPALNNFELAWSSDSRWIAYSRGLQTGNRAIFLFDADNGRRYQATSGYFSDTSPTFDPEGKYLYYLSSRNLSPIYSDLDATWVYPNSTRIMALPLRRDVASPLAPRNDDEPVPEEEKEQAASSEGSEAAEGAAEGQQTETPQPEKKAGGKGEKKEPAAVEIDLEGLESRAVVLPPEAGNYSRLRAVAGKVLFHRRPRSGSSRRSSPVAFFDLKDRKEQTVLDNADSFEISADGKKMLVRQGRDWSIVNVAPKQKTNQKLTTGDLEMTVDPRQEWRQLFREVWRAYRDFFYDPNLHGLDWDEMNQRYGSLLEDAVTRWDVNFVIGELIGEVNASHTYVGGGDTETPSRRQVGLLGIDWALEEGAYKIARIVRGAPWDAEARSPLAEPGVEASEGDYILAVNGRPLDTSREPYAAFEGLASKTVELTVNSAPSFEGARNILVETLSSESRLRNLEWIEHNRQRVEKFSQGQVGYIFVPNTGVFGQTELVRQFNSQIKKKGLIIDERFNGGGQLPDRFVELMSRKLVNRIAFRNGTPVSHPRLTHYGPKAMLINGWAGSGGDAFPYFFREMGVGPLIGERTWGGLIGPAVGHRMIDGGFFTAPPGRIYGPDGEWFPEGYGVKPDIPVVDDPGKMARGGDPQLEAAVTEVLRLIREEPLEMPAAPEFEKRVPGAR